MHPLIPPWCARRIISFDSWSVWCIQMSRGRHDRGCNKEYSERGLVYTTSAILFGIFTPLPHSLVPPPTFRRHAYNLPKGNLRGCMPRWSPFWNETTHSRPIALFAFLLRQRDAVEMRPVGEGAQGTREASRVVVRIQVLKRHKMLILAFAHLRPMSWCNDIIGAWLNCRSRVPRFREPAQAKLVSKRWIIFHKTWGRQLSRVSAHWINQQRSKKNSCHSAF